MIFLTLMKLITFRKGGIDMRGKKRNWIIVMLAVLALLLVLGPAVSVQAAEKKIKIGSIMPISGPLSVVGMAWTRGWELFFEKINEQGGIKVGHDVMNLSAPTSVPKVFDR